MPDWAEKYYHLSEASSPLSRFKPVVREPRPPVLARSNPLHSLIERDESVHAGLELFGGSCRITHACAESGICMHTPWGLNHGLDVLDKALDRFLRNHKQRLRFIFLAPPCSSFSGLQNLNTGGPLRPGGNPTGDESNPRIAIGNALWRRALVIAALCHSNGIPFFVEHPRPSKAWQMLETDRILQLPGIHRIHIDMCEYGASTKKPTSILSNKPWSAELCKSCQRGHVHAAHLHGARARAAGAYPWEFCQAFAGLICKHC